MVGEDHDQLEATVDEFLELEEQLDDRETATGQHDRGSIDGAAKVSAHEVPGDYPWAVETDEALRLDVDVGDGSVTCYLSWPEAGAEETHTEQLLDALGYDRAQFANLYGEEVALAHEGGWHRVDVRRTGAKRVGETETRRVDPLSGLTDRDLSVEPIEAVILAGMAASVSLFFAPSIVFDQQGTSDLFGMVMFAGLALTGGGIYWDLTKLKSRMEWDTDTARWVGGGLVPIGNVPVAIAYLVDRRVRLSGTGPGVVSETWYEVLRWSIVTVPVGFLLGVVNIYLGAAVAIYGSLLVPFAIYFDAEYVEDATDWDPSEERWAAAGLLAAFGYCSIFVGLAYLWLRRLKLD